jgi:hypothetical protein
MPGGDPTSGPRFRAVISASTREWGSPRAGCDRRTKRGRKCTNLLRWEPACRLRRGRRSCCTTPEPLNWSEGPLRGSEVDEESPDRGFRRSETPISSPETPKAASETPISSSETPKAASETPKGVSESPRVLLKFRERDPEISNRHSERRKALSEFRKGRSERRNHRSESRKVQSERRKNRSEFPKVLSEFLERGAERRDGQREPYRGPSFTSR